MIVVNIHEAKAKLSEYLDAVASGERVMICKRNQPVAELRAVAAVRSEPRPIGKAKGILDVPSTFFEPLPDQIVRTFWDRGEEVAPGTSKATDAKAAESRAGYRVTKPPGRRR